MRLVNLKLCQFDKLFPPVLNVFFSNVSHAAGSQFLDTEACRNGAHDDRRFHALERQIIDFGKIADKAACKGVACTGRIKYFF